MRRAAFLCFALLLPAMAADAAAAPAKFVSQREANAYMREGPSYNHRVLWVYKHKGYPFEVIARYDVWRRVRAQDGTVGWMSATMLTDRRTVLVTGRQRAPLYSDPEPRAKLVAYAMPGATASVSACAIRSCLINAPGLKGWIDKDRVWGVGRDEVFK
jgi:SH3-like domain-containing protein